MLGLVRSLAAAIPTASTQQIEGAGHAAPFDAPASLVQLIADTITEHLPAGVRLFDSAEAVARQTLRRIDALGRPASGSGRVEVFRSGVPGELPPAATVFAAGRALLAAPGDMRDEDVEDATSL